MVSTNKFKNILFEKRTNCAVCREKLGKPLIDLPNLPLTGIYTDKPVKEKVGFVDQFFYICKNCGHGQILNIISPEILYGDTYYFRTSVSATAVKATNFFVSFINSTLGEKHFNTIVEIGCSDLYLLKSLRARADKLVGIDPVLAGKEDEFSDDKIKVIGDFFEDINLKKYLKSGIDLILSSHTLEHVSDPKLFIKKLLDNATDKTLFVFQFPCLETLVHDCRFDQIFHQHFNYFSLKSVIYMLNDLGAELIDFKVNQYHWGTLMIIFKKKSSDSVDSAAKFASSITQISDEVVHKQYAIFQESMNLVNEQLLSFKNEIMYGYGAALMLPILSYHLKNDLFCLKCVVDDDKSKEGLHYINLPVSIKTPENISDFDNSVIIITAVDNSGLILPKARSLNPKKIVLLFNKNIFKS